MGGLWELWSIQRSFEFHRGHRSVRPVVGKVVGGERSCWINKVVNKSCL